MNQGNNIKEIMGYFSMKEGDKLVSKTIIS